MKIRIKGDSIRLRLSQTEVTQIGALISVVETTHFGNSKLTYSLSSAVSGEPVQVNFTNNEISVMINAELAKDWAISDTVGIRSNDSVIPNVLIEKDFQCLTVREGEDETDNFQNPNLVC
jgi:hypothetical protein